MAKKKAVEAEVVPETVVMEKKKAFPTYMNTMALIKYMSNTRDSEPQYFSARKVFANGKDHTLLSRSREATMYMDNQPQNGILIFGDQNPLGRSNLARAVYRGEHQAKDVRWLYFKNKSGAVTWLGHIILNPKNNTENITTFIDINYNTEKHEFSVIVPDRMPI